MGPALHTGVDCALHAVHAWPGRPELTHRCAPLVRGLVRRGPPAPQASCEPASEPGELDEQSLHTLRGVPSNIDEPPSLSGHTCSCMPGCQPTGKQSGDGSKAR